MNTVRPPRPAPPPALAACAAGLLLLAAGPLAAAGARVVVEAESAAATAAPVVTVQATNAPATPVELRHASGGAWLEIPEGAGNPPKRDEGHAAFTLDVPADGAYVLWARVWWEGTCSNSFTVQVDDKPPFLFGEDGTYHAWHWVRYPVGRLAAPIALTRGRHTLTFRNREDGVRLDQVALSSDARFVPVDVEPLTPPAAAPGGTTK